MGIDAGADDAVIGIDLGTTNSEVAIISGGRPSVVGDRDDAILPSCVGLDDAGAVIVGRQARNQAAAAPERTVLSVKRLMGSGERVRMGDGDYTPQERSSSRPSRSVRSARSAGPSAGPSSPCPPTSPTPNGRRRARPER